MKFKRSLCLLLILISVCGGTLPSKAQKKFTITVCIDGESRLHIKNGQLFWEHRTYMEPGTHQLCKTKTSVNGKKWEKWDSPFILGFKTNNMEIETKALQTNTTSHLVQAPSAANDWETIWVFNDDAIRGPHDYSVSFFFSPAKDGTKKDSIKAGAGASGVLPEPEKKMTPKAIKMVVDSLCYKLNEYYIYPDKAKLMSDAIRSQCRKGSYNKAKDWVELSSMISNDVRAAHKDDHFRLRYNPEMAKDIEAVMTDSDRVLQYRIDLKDMQEKNFFFVKAEILPGNVGYLRWDGFTGMVEEAAPLFKNAFRLVEHTKALIIDMRCNGGGSPDMVLHTQNYFFNKKVPMNHIMTRKDTSMRYTDPSKTEFKLMMPVYILTARRTFSGAEDFTYGMKYADRATVVGDTTGGGAHPTDIMSIGQGFVAYIPFGRSYHEITKTDWEGTGVRPDVPVNSESALYTAQTMILKDLLTKANDMHEKKDLQWNLDVAQNKIGLAKQILTDSIQISKETLLSYCGEYKPKAEGAPLVTMQIVFKGNNIYRRVKGSPDARLSPISATRFVYDDDSGRYFDFITDTTGKVTNVAVTRWDGTSFFEKIK